MCTLGLTWGQCRISGRISGTELDKRTWRFPLEEVRQKKTLSLWGKHFIQCLFDSLLLLVLPLSPDAWLQIVSEKSRRYSGLLEYRPFDLYTIWIMNNDSSFIYSFILALQEELGDTLVVTMMWNCALQICKCNLLLKGDLSPFYMSKSTYHSLVTVQYYGRWKLLYDVFCAFRVSLFKSVKNN